MSIHGTYQPDNIFARIIRGEAPCARVCEDDATLAFMDAFPQSPGHCLVVHKTSTARNLLDVAETDLRQIVATVQKLARAVQRSLQPDGVRVMQFNGGPAGQTVFHLHFHIVPIYAGRSLHAHGSGEPASIESMNALASRIASAIE